MLSKSSTRRRSKSAARTFLFGKRLFHGFILLYKRLEQGAYQWPRSESEVRSLTPQQYRWLMEGLKIEQPKAHCPVTGLAVL